MDVSILVKFWNFSSTYFANFIDHLHKEKFDFEFFSLLKESRHRELSYYDLQYLCALLEDSHTNVYNNEQHVYYCVGLRVEFVDNLYVVTAVHPRIADRIPLGSTLLEINNLPIEKQIEDSIDYISSSNLTIKINISLQQLLLGEMNQVKNILFQTPDQKVAEISTECLYRSYSDFVMHKDNQSLKKLTSLKETYYTKIISFDDKDYINNLKSRFNNYRKSCENLVIDIRGNTGGDSRLAAELLSLLTDVELHGSSWVSPKIIPCYEAWNSLEDDSIPSYPAQEYGHNLSVLPFDDSAMSFRIWVLTDIYTASAAEDFLHYIRQIDRCTIIGEKTTGSSGQPINLDLGDGFSCRICTKHDYFMFPNDFIRVGISPDIEVHTSKDDIAIGYDAVLSRCISTIQKSYSK